MKAKKIIAGLIFVLTAVYFTSAVEMFAVIPRGVTSPSFMAPQKGTFNDVNDFLNYLKYCSDRSSDDGYGIVEYPLNGGEVTGNMLEDVPGDHIWYIYNKVTYNDPCYYMSGKQRWKAPLDTAQKELIANYDLSDPAGIILGGLSTQKSTYYCLPAQFDCAVNGERKTFSVAINGRPIARSGEHRDGLFDRFKNVTLPGDPEPWHTLYPTKWGPCPALPAQDYNYQTYPAGETSLRFIMEHILINAAGDTLEGLRLALNNTNYQLDEAGTLVYNQKMHMNDWNYYFNAIVCDGDAVYAFRNSPDSTEEYSLGYFTADDFYAVVSIDQAEAVNSPLPYTELDRFDMAVFRRYADFDPETDIIKNFIEPPNPLEDLSKHGDKINIAYGLPTQSTDPSSAVVVDGLLDATWTSTGTTPEIAVTWQAEEAVYGYKIYWETGCFAKKYDVYYKTKANPAWQYAFAMTNNTDSTELALSVDPTVCNGVKFVLKEKNSDHYGIKEILLLANEPQPLPTPTPVCFPAADIQVVEDTTGLYTNIALGKPVIASSTYSSAYPAIQAVDGDLTTGWGNQPALPDTTPNIVIDLGYTATINGYHCVWHSTYKPGTYYISTSTDGTTWSLYKTIAASTGNDKVVESTTRTCRYVKVHWDDPAANLIYGLMECIIYDAKSDVTAIDFTDNETLEYAFKELVNKPYANAPVYTTDAFQIEALNISMEGLTDISALQYCTGLKKLIAPFNSIADLTPLQNLTNLEELDLTKHRVKDAASNITKLAGLINLKKLTLNNLEAAGGQTIDISFLQNLTEITDLDIGNLVDHSSTTDLSKLTKLENLNVTNNGYTNYGFKKLFPDPTKLADLTALKTLIASHNNLNTMTFISRIPSLVTIDLSYNTISVLDLTDDETFQMPGVTYLSLAHNRLSSLKDLDRLPNLEYLTLANQEDAGVKTLTETIELASISNLKQLDLSHNNILSMSDITDHTQLERLDISYNNLTGLSAFTNLTALLYIDLSNNSLTNISPLNNKPFISLDLSNNNVSANDTHNDILQVLTVSTGVKYLNVQGNNLDITGQTTNYQTISNFLSVIPNHVKYKKGNTVD